MKVTLSSMWTRLPWAMPVWDAAYQYLVRAGTGDAVATKEIEGVKAAAAAGHTQWQQIKRNFDAVAKLVLAGKPKPSTFVPQARRASPLLPGGAARRGAPTGAASQVAAMKKAQVERIQKQALINQAKQRVAQERAMATAALTQQRSAHEAELQQYEDNLAATQRLLENRDMRDDMRKQLEAQAEQYEALIEKMKTPEAKNEPITAVTPEGAEALADDAAEAYPSGAPGDVEFNDGGQG